MTTSPQSQNGILVALVLNGEQTGAGFLPLPDTYAQAEQGLQDLIVSTRSALARLYEERARNAALSEQKRADAMTEEVARLQAELALLRGASE